MPTIPPITPREDIPALESLITERNLTTAKAPDWCAPDASPDELVAAPENPYREGTEIAVRAGVEWNNNSPFYIKGIPPQFAGYAINQMKKRMQAAFGMGRISHEQAAQEAALKFFHVQASRDSWDNDRHLMGAFKMAIDNLITDLNNDRRRWEKQWVVQYYDGKQRFEQFADEYQARAFLREQEAAGHTPANVIPTYCGFTQVPYYNDEGQINPEAENAEASEAANVMEVLSRAAHRLSPGDQYFLQILVENEFALDIMNGSLQKFYVGGTVSRETREERVTRAVQTLLEQVGAPEEEIRKADKFGERLRTAMEWLRDLRNEAMTM